MKYVSRRYLKEKWDKLKWDMEKIVDVYSQDNDEVDEQTVNRTKNNIREMCEAIMNEIRDWDEQGSISD